MDFSVWGQQITQNQENLGMFVLCVCFDFYCLKMNLVSLLTTREDAIAFLQQKGLFFINAER
jgi:hypothetical protein